VPLRMHEAERPVPIQKRGTHSNTRGEERFKDRRGSFPPLPGTSKCVGGKKRWRGKAKSPFPLHLILAGRVIREKFLDHARSKKKGLGKVATKFKKGYYCVRLNKVPLGRTRRISEKKRETNCSAAACGIKCLEQTNVG